MKRWTVADVMTRDIITVHRDAPYKEIVDELAQHAVSAVPVVDDDGRVLGVVSEADLLHKMEFAGDEVPVRLLERKRRRTARAKAHAETARDLMTSPAVVIGPAESLTTAARLLDAEQVKRLPVVGADGRLAGIVSRRDLLRVYLRDDEALRVEVVDQVLRRTLWIEPGAVSVTVARGVVTLAGTVDRRSTAGIAVHLTEGVAGVIEVVDHLRYQYDDTHATRYANAQ